MTVLMNASQTKTQSLALSCLYTVIDAVPEKAATAIVFLLFLLLSLAIMYTSCLSNSYATILIRNK